MSRVPLFPLSHGVFPDGALQLNIFEVRYLDLIRRSHREGVPFGVPWLAEGHEAVARTARSIFPLADAANDEPTADLLTQRLAVHEMAAWMLRSLLED